MYALMRSQYNDELVKIDTERGDGTLPQIKSWFPYRRATEGEIRNIDTASLEVYPAPLSGSFPSATRDRFSQLATPGSPMQSTVTIRVLVAASNFDQAPPEIMQDRADRYVAAMQRVVRDDPTLAHPQSIICTPSNYNHAVGGADADAQVQAVMEFFCQLSEGSAGEGTAAGGEPPAIDPQVF